MKEQFVYTNNPETKTMLENLGFKLFKDNNGCWIFINKEINDVKFSKLDGVVFSNKLTF